MIPNCIDSNFIQKKLSESPDNSEHNLKFDHPIIVSVGRLEREKAFDVALKAFSMVREKMPCYYWILGKGSQEAHLKQIAADLNISDSVYFLGFQDNPYMFLKHTDVFLLTSQYEGFSNALLEAMYCGVPCVVTKYDTSITAFIRNDIDGLLVDVDNPENIAQGVEKLLNDQSLRQEIGAQAQKKMQQYTIDNIIKQYEELFMEYAKK